MLKLVPFNAEWVAHETLDLHAIYRRPKRDWETGAYQRDPNGFIQWDLTTGLPLRSHAKWVSKGFEYVTLASREDVVNAADPERAVDGVTPLRNPDEYLGQNRRTNGPWDASQYLADQAEAYQQRVTKLKTRVAEYGPVAAEEFEQQHDSDYRLPESLKATTGAPDAEPPKRRRGRPRKAESVEVAA